MEDERRWQAARRLLCVRLDSIGDVLMMGPAIRALRGSGEGREVTLLTSPSGAAVARLMPEVDDVIVYEAPWMKATATRRVAARDFEMIGQLEARRFDAAIIFTAYSQSPLPAALLAYLAGIPLRLAHCRENPYQLLTDWVPDPEPENMARHEVQRQLDLVGSIGAKAADTRLRVRVTDGARNLVREMLADCGVQPGTYVVVHPGGTAPSRRYPPELFAEVVTGLEGQGLSVIVTGDGTEREIVAQTLSRSKGAAVDLSGRLSLEQLCAVIADGRVLIAGNTGPVHLAAAVGTPVVDLYALTNPQHTPWGVPSRVLSHPVACQWCYKSVCPEGHHLCLRGVAPASVVAAAFELLEEGIERGVPGRGAVDTRA